MEKLQNDQIVDMTVSTSTTPRKMMPIKLDNSIFQMNYEVHPNLLDQNTLFIHGNMASNGWWRPMISVLNKQSIELHKEKTLAKNGSVIMAEWKGCGNSSSPNSVEDLQMNSLANDYIYLITQLGYSESKKINLVGHSTGGLISLLITLKRPELINKIVLLDSVGAKGLSVPKEILAAFDQMQKDKNLLSQVMSGTIHGVDVTSSFFNNVIVNDAWNVAPLNWRGVLENLEKMDISTDLKFIDAPILVLHGEKDVVLPLADSEYLAKNLPNAIFKILPNQGHSCNVENPEYFVWLMNMFFANKSVSDSQI